MKELSALFIEYRQSKKVDVYEIFSDYVNGDEFDVESLRNFIDLYIEQLNELKLDCNKINFMVDSVGYDWLMVYNMAELDNVMDGWKASEVCFSCCHDKFCDRSEWFYIGETDGLAYSSESLSECFEEYGDLDSFIMDLEDGLNEYYDMWSNESIEDNERNACKETELGCIYLY